MEKRLIKKSIETDNMTGVPPMIPQKAPSDYKDFNDFIENATQEEIDQYMENMDQESIERQKGDNFKDEKYW